MESGVVKNILVLHGDDTFSISREVKRELEKFGSPAEIEMNSLRLDGKTASQDEIHNAVSTLPFFGSQRMVILEGLPARMDKARQERFVGMLKDMPTSTNLVITLEDHRRWRRDGGKWLQTWDVLNEGHWLAQWMDGRPNVAVKAFPLPDAREMDAWILKEAAEQGGKFTPDAARALGQFLGNDTSIASQEIGKLLMYVNGKRPVNGEDVVSLVSDAGTSDVFSMLDAMLEGRSKEAQAMLNRLLDDTAPEVILGAMSHRFRQLVQVREALDSGGDLQKLVAQRVIFGSGKQVERISAQARRFTMSRLKYIFQRLLELDIQSKTSAIDLGVNLEILVVELSRE